MLKLFKNISKKDWLLVFASLGLIAVQVWLELTMPDYMSEITFLVQTSESSISSILKAGGKMLLCALGSLVSAVIVAILASRIASDFAAALRSRLFNKVQDFSMEEIGRFSTASLITRTTNDVTQVQMFITMGLQVMVKAPILAIWAVIKIAGKNTNWTLTTGAAVVSLLIVVCSCLLISLPKVKKLQMLTDNLNRVTRENLNGIKVVRAYNAEKYQQDKFEVANDELTGTHLFVGRTMAFMMPGIQLIMNGLSLAIYWVGAYMIDRALPMDRVALFSDMIVFMQYAAQVVMAFMMLVMIFVVLPRASVAAKRINEVIDTDTTIHDGDRENAPEGVSGEVEFKNVSFKYPDAEDYVIKNINFKVKKGETLAIIGATGSGKSTTINLIPRFYDATEGEVLVDGINVKEYRQESLRNLIGYVSQKAILFSGDIESNIKYGENKNDGGDVKKAVNIAQAAEFVDKLEEGYNAYVAQGGENFSGGQKQRLSIARAIYRNPEILIFDDSFSALDYKTDRILRSELKKECKDATKIIVAQRIGTIRDADNIVVLDDGEIAGIGTHSELMKDCETYRQIAYSQLSKEELA